MLRNGQDNVSFLNIGPNRTTETDLPMRDNSEAVRVIRSEERRVG